MNMVAFHSARRHSESDIRDMISWCLKHRQNPSHWVAKLKEIKLEQLHEGNRARRRKERAEKAAGASQ